MNVRKLVKCHRVSCSSLLGLGPKCSPAQFRRCPSELFRRCTLFPTLLRSTFPCLPSSLRPTDGAISGHQTARDRHGRAPEAHRRATVPRIPRDCPGGSAARRPDLSPRHRLPRVPAGSQELVQPRVRGLPVRG